MAGVNAVYRIPLPTIHRIDTGQRPGISVDLGSCSDLARISRCSFNRGYPLIPTFVRARFLVISVRGR